MVILEDVANKKAKHVTKNNRFAEMGHEVIRVPLPVGDYILLNEKVSNLLERKQARKKLVGEKQVRLKNGTIVTRKEYELGVKLDKLSFLGTFDKTVDTKFSIDEIMQNVCGSSHDRFRDECILAQNNNIQLYVLIENQGELITKDIFNKTVRCIDDLHEWKNPRLFVMKNSNEVVGYFSSGKPKFKKIQAYPKATKGKQLAAAMRTMETKYGVKFVFCTPEESADKVIELLS